MARQFVYFMLVVLSLIDVVMISNLLVMVIVGGYETFVSRLNLEGHPDEPEWLSHVNASVLKIKLAMAIIGISSIHLLRTFIEAGGLGTAKTNYTETGVMWQTIIHIVFILSAVGIAYVDRLSNDVHVVDEIGDRGFILDHDHLIAVEDARRDVVVSRLVVETIAEDGVAVGADLEVERNPHQRLPLEAGELQAGGSRGRHRRIGAGRGHQLGAGQRRAGDAIDLAFDLPVAGSRCVRHRHGGVARHARAQQQHRYQAPQQTHDILPAAECATAARATQASTSGAIRTDTSARQRGAYIVRYGAVSRSSRTCWP